MQLNTEIFARHKAPPESLTAVSGRYTNWLGLKTDLVHFPSRQELSGKVVPDVPLGDDGVYGGWAEYASLLTAIEAAPSKERFAAVELGAGWGPWISAIGVVCKRQGFKRISLRGVEAHEGKCALMREHLTNNDLDKLDCSVIHGAAWKEDTTVRFSAMAQADHGGAATAEKTSQDYRGHVGEFVEVPAYSLPTICKGLDVIDYMHWDVQGAELPLAESSEEFLNKRVRYLFIGTHSRPIEGRLLEIFFKRKWELLYQHPCHFVYDLRVPTLEGMGRTDGEMYFKNPNL